MVPYTTRSIPPQALPTQSPLAYPFIIFMHLAFLHLLPLCLLLRLRRNDFSMLRYDLSFLQIPQAGASYARANSLLCSPPLRAALGFNAGSQSCRLSRHTYSCPPLPLFPSYNGQHNMHFISNAFSFLPCSARFMSSSYRT